MRYGFIAASVLAAGVLAVTSVQAAEVPRIGVANLQEVIATSQAGQDAHKQLQALQQKLQGDFSDRQQKTLVLKQQLDKADSKSADYPKLLKNYEDSRSDLQQFVLMGRQDLQQRNEELLQPVEQELGKVLNEYGKTHHYDIILSESAAGAVFASAKYDITKQITTALDQDWAQLQKSKSSQKPSGGGQ